MNKSRFDYRTIGAIFGGLLLSASFAPLNLSWAAWLGPGILLFSSLGLRGWKAFRIGFLGGLIHFLTSLYWLLHMPLTWHGIPFAPALAWIALSAYCALYPAIWVWLGWRLLPKVNDVDDFLAAKTLQRIAWAFALGTMWTALEFGRGLILSGFPWNLLGASQYRMVPLIQIASITGIYGVSFLVVWTSTSICATAVQFLHRPKQPGMWRGFGLPMLVVLVICVWGTARLTSAPIPTRTLKIAMIQPSAPQTLIWDPSADKDRFQTVLQLSHEAMASHPQLLLWPESAMPDIDVDLQQAIADLVRAEKTWLVFVSGTLEESNYYCSSLMCDPEGALQGIYHKRRLVIFGEYVPLVHWFPFLKWLTSVGTDITPGSQLADFQMTEPRAKLSALICFEDMFAQEAREHVGLDTDFLVNLTNDGWFGHGPEQWQQAATGIFRAVENGVPIVRCTNDGLTCWADAYGRIRQIFNRDGDVYAQGTMAIEIPLRNLGNQSRTVYNQYGDWFPYACAGCGAIALWFRRRSLRTDSRDTVRV